LSDPKTSDDKIHVRNLWTEIYDEKGDLINDIGTWVSIRISYPLRHGAKKWDIAISPQGYASIADIIEWLIEDMNVMLKINDIKRLEARDLKGRFIVLNDSIRAVNGHSMDLPELTFPEYDETLGGNPRYLVHEIYSKCLPAILEEGVSRMARNNIHMSKTTGYAGLQRRRKPNISITIDVTKGKAGGTVFTLC